jgi:hypothetical protein
MIEFPQTSDTPHPLGLRGVEHRPGNLLHLALVRPPTPLAEPRKSPWHRTSLSTFDQEDSNCTTEAAVGLLITLPFRTEFRVDSASLDTEAERLVLYKYSQQFDPWPGTDYDGTSTDAPFLALKARGVITGWDWLMGEGELWEWVSRYGPAAVGTLWKNGMFYPDPGGYLHLTDGDAGGHAYEIAFASQPRQAYRIINSWGTGWGQTGRAWITRKNMRTLLAEDGEAVTVKLPS